MTHPFMQTTIKYPDRMAQNKDFRNLKLNGYTPSDIDVVYEVKGRVFIFGELKVEGTRLPTGQALLLQHIGDVLHAAGKSALIFVAEHDTVYTEAIDVGNLFVKSVYITHEGDERRRNPSGITVQKACDDFLKMTTAG
jgi:hypothetical protein